MDLTQIIRCLCQASLSTLPDSSTSIRNIRSAITSLHYKQDQNTIQTIKYYTASKVIRLASNFVLTLINTIKALDTGTSPNYDRILNTLQQFFTSYIMICCQPFHVKIWETISYTWKSIPGKWYLGLPTLFFALKLEFLQRTADYLTSLL